MWKIVRKNKAYNKRYLKIYYDSKLINSIYPFYNWFFYGTKPEDEISRMSCRIKALENLY